MRWFAEVGVQSAKAGVQALCGAGQPGPVYGITCSRRELREQVERDAEMRRLAEGLTVLEHLSAGCERRGCITLPQRDLREASQMERDVSADLAVGPHGSQDLFVERPRQRILPAGERHRGSRCGGDRAHL